MKQVFGSESLHPLRGLLMIRSCGCAWSRGEFHLSTTWGGGYGASTSWACATIWSWKIWVSSFSTLPSLSSSYGTFDEEGGSNTWTSSSSSLGLMSPTGMYFMAFLNGSSPTSSRFSCAPWEPLDSSNYTSYVPSTKPVAWLNTRYVFDFDE